MKQESGTPVWSSGGESLGLQQGRKANEVQMRVGERNKRAVELSRAAASLQRNQLAW